jgi:hypothetical protein
MHWGGWDPDGEIAYYEYCITDNEVRSFDPADTVGGDEWSRVYSHDSTFTFTADVLADTNTTSLSADFTRSHTFFIRAVDREGLASPAPAYRSFTAHTLSPDVKILVPRKNALNPAEVPPITTFRWEANDYISDKSTRQDPDSVSWILVPTASHGDDWVETIDWVRRLAPDAPEWRDWAWYKAPEDSGKSWTTPPMDMGNYVFAIRAKDEAGAITPVFDENKNVRRVLVSTRTTGPILTVQNQYMGSIQTAVCNHPLTILDLPAGVPVEFHWTADASNYGGTAVGYRYGWDITDLDDPAQWEIDLTPFRPHDEGEPASARTNKSRSFYFGTHVFTVEVIDNSGFCSRAEIKINIVEFTMERDLLLMDDYVESEWGGWWHLQGKGTEPNDAEHDRFWARMLSELAAFENGEDVIDVSELSGRVVRLDKLARYKSIIWSVKSDRAQHTNLPMLHEFVKFRPKDNAISAGKQHPNLMALFMAAGGHVFVCGYHPLSVTIDKAYAHDGVRYPVIFKYDLDLRSYSQEDWPTTQMVQNPPGNESYPYHDLCVETMDYSVTSATVRRPADFHCPVNSDRWVPLNSSENAEYLRTRSMRAAMPVDPEFPRLELRPETAAFGKAHDPAVKGLDVEVYNPQYFFDVCISVQKPRDCFEGIYGLECFETSEPTYAQPIAFWSSAFADVRAAAPGAVAGRSVVFGFPPVMCDTTAVRHAIETILYDEWRLSRK